MFEGSKLIIGVPNRKILLRFIINFISIITISVSLASLNLSNLQIGLLSTFISNQLKDVILIYTNNNLFVVMFEISFFILSIFLILASFKIKIKKVYKIIFFFKIFKFITYLNFFLIFKYIFRRSKNKNVYTKKSEPTFLKKSLKLKSSKNNGLKKIYKQKELDEFRFSLPKKSLLEKSISRNL